MLFNVLLIVGMVIVLLLIIGVLGAFRGPRSAMALVPGWSDPDAVDLEDRLRKITLSAMKSTEGGQAGVPVLGGASLPVPARTITPPGAGRVDPTAVRAPEPSSRLALPGSGTVRPNAAPAAATGSAGQGLNPLAARFAADQLPAGMPAGPASKRLGLPGTVARDLPPSGDRFAPAGAAGFAPIPQIEPPLSSRSALPSSGRSSSPAALPPSERFSAPPPAPLSAPPSKRLELPGRVAPARDGAVFGTPSLDIQAILRGEPAPPLGGSAAEQTAPRKPNFATGPLSPSSVPANPWGADPFDRNNLQARDLAPTQPPPNAVYDLNGPANYADTGIERVAANGRLVDLDATRIVEDFDLPDTGFETHVFSTSELVNGEAMTFPTSTSQAFPPGQSFPVQPESIATAARSAFSGTPPPRTAPPPRMATRPSVLTVAGHEQARRMVIDVAEMQDVIFARLLTRDGEALLTAGADNGDVRIDEHIAGMLGTAIMEVQQIDLGECSSLAVEAPSAALLLSPLPGGVCLAVLLGNPARLGLMRRQIRKALTELHEVLSESSVS